MFRLVMTSWRSCFMKYLFHLKTLPLNMTTNSDSAEQINCKGMLTTDELASVLLVLLDVELVEFLRGTFLFLLVLLFHHLRLII